MDWILTTRLEHDFRGEIMAKRLTDTAKWDKAWFRKLGSKLRDIRQFCLDKCDHAGLLEIDFETFEHFIGEPISEQEISQAFRGKIAKVDDKFFFPDFIEFQYKCSVNDLNPANKVHCSVLRRLKDLQLLSPMQAPCLGVKDKIKEKDMEKDRVYETSEDLFASLPIQNLEKWNHDYGADFVADEIPKCFLYWTLNEAKTPRTPGQWHQKVYSWLSLAHERKQKNTSSENSSFCGFAKEPS